MAKVCRICGGPRWSSAGQETCVRGCAQRSLSDIIREEILAAGIDKFLQQALQDKGGRIIGLSIGQAKTLRRRQPLSIGARLGEALYK